MLDRITYSAALFIVGFLFITGCSTHYLLEGNTLNEQGAYTEAAALYERAAKGKNKQKAFEALIPIYVELNVHDRALACLDSIEAITGLTPELEIKKAQTLMALGRYAEAKEIYEADKSNPLSQARLDAILSLDARQADSVFFKVRPINIISTSIDGSQVASAAMPHRVGDELYFVVESPRKHLQKRGSETYIDDYTGNRLMDLWKGTLVDTMGVDAPLELVCKPMLESNTDFHDGVVAFKAGEDEGVLGMTYIKPQPTFFKKLGTPVGERITQSIQLFSTALTHDYLGNTTWETVDRLAFCDDEFMFAHPALSPDGRTLYFTSDMPGGEGGMDIWRSTKLVGTWSTPVNLGDVVNTRGDEAFPTMRHADTLYFSSDGHKGLGGLDIVYASKNSDLEWNSVYDLYPYPINSSGDDFGVQLYAEGTSGIFASDRNGIDALFHFSDYDPEITLFVEIIHESDGTPWPDIKAALEHMGDDESVGFFSDHEGKWSTRIRREQTYMIQCPESFGYTADPFITPEDQTLTSITVIVPIPMVIVVGCLDPLALNYNPDAMIDDGKCEYVIEEVEVVEEEVPGCTVLHACNYNPLATIDDGTCEYLSCITEDDVVVDEVIEESIIEGDVVALNINWDYDNAVIRNSDLPIVAAFARYLLANSDSRVLIIAHCDSRATDYYNDSLSQKRTQAVEDELVRFGVEEERIRTYGASEQFLLRECEDENDCDESVHQLNRRTTANIISSGERIFIHRVKPSETLYGLSKKYNVSIDEIKEWNGLKSQGMRVAQDILIYLP